MEDKDLKQKMRHRVGRDILTFNDSPCLLVKKGLNIYIMENKGFEQINLKHAHCGPCGSDYIDSIFLICKTNKCTFNGVFCFKCKESFLSMNVRVDMVMLYQLKVMKLLIVIFV